MCFKKINFEINHYNMEEFHSATQDIPACSYLFQKNDINHDNFDWRKNPYAALPQCLGLCSEKL